jgi:hypothetical protein
MRESTRVRLMIVIALGASILLVLAVVIWH